MRLYLITTCAVFALLAIAHLLRLVLDGPGLMTDPWFVGVTILTLGLAGWGWLLLRRWARAPDS